MKRTQHPYDVALGQFMAALPAREPARGLLDLEDAADAADWRAVAIELNTRCQQEADVTEAFEKWEQGYFAAGGVA